jgi:HdeA/HdeB family
MRLAIALAVALASAIPAHAAEATCSDYIAARGQDRSLFDGFVYGFVTAKLEDRSDAVINSATVKVKDMTLAYCIQRPNDRVSKVIATFAATIAHILPEQ